MQDHIYSFDKIYKYELVVEPILPSEEPEYRGYIYNKNFKMVYKSKIFDNPEMCRMHIINELEEYLNRIIWIDL
jgi:hypothetical protein